jgi:LSD1 subclass zinc finger protein
LFYARQSFYYYYRVLRCVKGYIDAAFSGQALCRGCRQILVFEVGASFVRCNHCLMCTATPAPEAYTCRCGFYVSYTSTTATPMCIVCYTLRPSPAPVTATLAPLPPPDISPVAASALDMPYMTAPLPPGFYVHDLTTHGASRSSYNLLPSTPVLAVPGPRPTPIPRARGRPPPATPSRQPPVNGSAQPLEQLDPPSTSALVSIEELPEPVFGDEEHRNREAEQPGAVVLHGAAEDIQQVPQRLARDSDDEGHSTESKRDSHPREGHGDKLVPRSEGSASDNHIDLS